MFSDHRPVRDHLETVNTTTLEIHTDESEGKTMNKVRSHDGTAIAFDRAGKGPSVILVDGAFCSRSFGPMPQIAPLLAQQFTVFGYDRRGRNDSGDTAPYAVEREVEDLEALIAEAGGSASVYGVSSGGALAFQAASAGLSIRKLAVHEPPFMVDDGAPRPPADHEAQLTEMVSSGRRDDAVAFFMTSVVGMPTEAVAGLRGMPMWPALEAVAHTLAYDAAVMGDYSLPSERLASLTVPTLVVDGAKSDERLRKAVGAVVDAVPNARRRTLEDQRHDAAPEAIAPVLKEFFAD